MTRSENWLQPLHALTFRLWYLAFSNWLQNRVPPDIRATCQGILPGCDEPRMAAATSVGQVISATDVRSVYGVAVIPALLAFSLYFVSTCAARKSGSPKYESRTCLWGAS